MVAYQFKGVLILRLRRKRPTVQTFFLSSPAAAAAPLAGSDDVLSVPPMQPQGPASIGGEKHSTQGRGLFFFACEPEGVALKTGCQ